jgi:hypothetical protein
MRYRVRMPPTGTAPRLTTRVATRRVVMSQAQYEAQFHRPPTQEDRDRVRALLAKRAA